jgi:hypothetical protein
MLEQFLGKRFFIQINPDRTGIFQWRVMVGLQDLNVKGVRFNHGQAEGDDLLDAIFDACAQAEASQERLLLPLPVFRRRDGSIEQFQETALNVMYNVASIFTMPVEILIRPQFGSRYFSAPNLFLSAIMLTLAAAFTTLTQSVGQMIPFVRVRGPAGMFGLGSLTTLFFLANIVHGLRIWRRMIDMSREGNSMFEGLAMTAVILPEQR